MVISTTGAAKLLDMPRTWRIGLRDGFLSGKTQIGTSEYEPVMRIGIWQTDVASKIRPVWSWLPLDASKVSDSWDNNGSTVISCKRYFTSKCLHKVTTVCRCQVTDQRCPTAGTAVTATTPPPCTPRVSDAAASATVSTLVLHFTMITTYSLRLFKKSRWRQIQPYHYLSILY